MRLLVLSDIHARAEMAAEILRGVHGCDLVLIAGDLTSGGSGREADHVIGSLLAVDPSVPMLAVRGNCDGPGVADALEKARIFVEDRLVDRCGILIAGVGGGLHHHGVTVFERRDRELGNSLDRALGTAAPGVSPGGADPRPLVVLSHTPPYGSGADLRHGRPTGSRELSRRLATFAPAAWICGHTHESRCAIRTQGCLVVNPGSVAEGYYALVELEHAAGGPARVTGSLHVLE